MDTLQPLLATHPFFEGLEPCYYPLLVGCASHVRFNRGEVIFRTGEEATQFYIIRHGKIALEIPDRKVGTVTLQVVETGGVLGWSWLFPPYHWHFNARVLEFTRAIAFDGGCLRAQCEEDHKLGYELMKRFAWCIEYQVQAETLKLLDFHKVP